MEELPADLRHLYLEWVENEIEKCARAQKKSEIQYKRAYESLKKHDSIIFHPNELNQLKFFGPSIIKLLTRKLEQYCRDNGIDSSFLTEVAAKRPITMNEETSSTGGTTKKRKRTVKEYVPAHRSGSYAILLAILENDITGDGVDKHTIISNGAKYTDSSFSNHSTTGQFYSAWSNMKSLLSKELVLQVGRPSRYYLSEAGQKLAELLKETDKIEFGRDSASSSASRTNTMDSSVDLPATKTEYAIWEPDSYEIMLILDNREIRSHQDRGFFLNKLSEKGCDVDQRPLVLGDALWIARHKRTGAEAVLDFILERKRLDDLSSSIIDGRFHEQKTRLRRCGIKNVFYLIEEITSSDVSNMSEAIQTAISMSLTVSNFHIERTKDADDTIKVLVGLNKSIKFYYQEQTLIVINPQNLTNQFDFKKSLNEYQVKYDNELKKSVHKYDTFNVLMSKSNLTTAREMFIRHLMTIRGITMDKAILIQSIFKTSIQLYKEFNSKDTKNVELFGKKVCELIGQVYQDE